MTKHPTTSVTNRARRVPTDTRVTDRTVNLKAPDPRLSYRERHKALGLCIACRSKAAPGKLRCVVHLGANRKSAAAHKYAATSKPGCTKRCPHCAEPTRFGECVSCGLIGEAESEQP